MSPDHLAKLKAEYEELNQKLSSASTDPTSLKTLSRRHLELGRLISKAEEIEHLQKSLIEHQEMAEKESDPELQKLALEEVEQAEIKLPQAEEELKRLLIPHDPVDDSDAIVEIRAGTGGDEAALFAAELLRMYTRYAERQNFKTNLDSVSRSELGGIKEAILEIKGDGAYGNLKYEGGVHRVQRVPETEKSGRVHTSTASVAVLPLLEQNEFSLDPKEVQFEASTASGHGGQSVNTTYSAVRLLHIPTGIRAQSQDERSQAQNKEKAWRVLTARVAAHYAEIRDAELRDTRRSQIKGAERSDKIRTYNFPQDRVTDHRLNENFHQINNFLDGDIADMISKLHDLDEQEKLAKLEDSAS